jgi:hypothetical protein
MARSGGIFDFIKAKLTRIGVESIIGYTPSRALSDLGADDFITKSMLSGGYVPGVRISVNTYPFTITAFSTTYPQFSVPCFFLREYTGTEKVPVNPDIIRYDTATDILTIDRGFLLTGDLTIFQP